MGWYQVVKTIKGRRYTYLQRTYRAGGQVKTENRYVGPLAPEATGATTARSTDDRAELADIRAKLQAVATPEPPPASPPVTTTSLRKAERATTTPGSPRAIPPYPGESYSSLEPYAFLKEVIVFNPFLRKTSPLSQAVIDEWKQRIRAGEKPAIVLADEPTGPRIIDGRHRLEAYKQLGCTEVPVISSLDVEHPEKGFPRQDPLKDWPGVPPEKERPLLYVLRPLADNALVRDGVDWWKSSPGKRYGWVEKLEQTYFGSGKYYVRSRRMRNGHNLKQVHNLRSYIALAGRLTGERVEVMGPRHHAAVEAYFRQLGYDGIEFLKDVPKPIYLFPKEKRPPSRRRRPTTTRGS